MKYTISKGKEKQTNIQEKKLLCLYYYSNGKKSLLRKTELFLALFFLKHLL